MRRKWGLVLTILLLGGLVWYLFLKPHDYVIRFKTKALPGTINQSLKAWGDRLEDAEFLRQDELSDLKYRYAFNDSIYTYHWKFKSLNDSVRRVMAYITDDEHSLSVRSALPFSETDFEKRAKNTVANFAEELQEHLANFKVQITGKDSISEKYCACVKEKGTQIRKARGMMQNYSFIINILAQNEIALDGRPMVEVKEWNMKNDSISYNFCFPIIPSDSLPRIKDIFYRKINVKPALRAVYNGNYITSDRAWYALLDHAEKKNIAIEEKPLEIFHSNPNMGGNELEWKTEVFIPIKE